MHVERVLLAKQSHTSIAGVIAAYAQAILAYDYHSYMHTVRNHRVARSSVVTLAKAAGVESSIATSSLLTHWRQGLSRETASLLRGNFGGKVAVVGLHMRATWAKCLHCSSMLVWIATEVWWCQRVALVVSAYLFCS